MFTPNVSIPIAKKKSNKFDWSCSHVTTQDFNKMFPVYVHECIPGEHISIDCSAFCRLDALKKPMYGSAKIVNRAFFVPFRTVMSNWHEFITQARAYGNYISNVPKIDPLTIVNLLASGKYSTTTEDPDIIANEAYDFILRPNSSVSTFTYHIFNDNGKRIHNILRNLGYHLPFNVVQNLTPRPDPVSALPLLAYLRLYLDYYQNRQYFTDELYKYFDGARCVFGQYYVTPLDSSDLDKIFDQIKYTNWASDYFTTAFERPNLATAMSNGRSITITDDTRRKYDGSSITAQITDKITDSTFTDYASVPSISSLNVGAGGITQFALNQLQSLSNYLTRNNLAGARALNRFLARYGYRVRDEKLNQSVYLGKMEQDIEIADVTSYADTGSELSNLGVQAGKGFSFGNGHFEFDSEEDFGFIIITSNIEPRSAYYQGQPRYMQHLTPLDFFTPEFDANGGMQPIRVDEIAADAYVVSDNSAGYSGNKAFGYTSRYGEYKTQPYDYLSGDFVLNSKNTALEAYHLMRTIPTQPNLPSISASFQRAETAQFDRIFNYTEDDYDHFTTIFRFNVTGFAPMAKLFDDYNLEENHQQEGTTADMPMFGQRF